MRERSTERWLDIEGEEQPAGDKSAVKKACFVLVAMFTALVTLFVAAPANAVIGSSEVTVADTKVSFFQENDDDALNNEVSDTQKISLMNWAQRTLDKNVTQLSAFRV